MRIEKDNILKYIQKKSYIKRFFQFLLGCFIISVAYNVFIVPNNLIPGGTTGLAIIINNLFGINNSTFIFITNLFLLVISYIFLGKEKTRNTILGSIIFPLFVRLTENLNVYLQVDTSNMLLSTIFGGIIFGFGIGLVFKAGYTIGGTDTINHINAKYLKISVGKSILFVDGLIALSSGIFIGVNNMLYSIVLIYLLSYISDRVVLGISDCKAFFIVTNKEEKIKDFITNTLKYQVTSLKAKGGFKREDENVILTVLPTRYYYQLKEGIDRIDKNAFYIITDTYEVFGGDLNEKQKII